MPLSDFAVYLDNENILHADPVAGRGPVQIARDLGGRYWALVEAASPGLAVKNALEAGFAVPLFATYNGPDGTVMNVGHHQIASTVQDNGVPSDEIVCEIIRGPQSERTQILGYLNLHAFKI